MSPSGKTPAFREIMALKTSAERIHVFRASRDQFANTNTGLSQWISGAGLQHQEHAVVAPPSGRPAITTKGLPGVPGHPPSPSTSKTSPQSGQSQQPYYQQYLNFSNTPGSPSQAPPPGQPGPSTSGPVESSQGFAPTGNSGGGIGGGKLTTHQVQAKGKDILHTAGVFGGKANVAAKGLFAKGKSRFRGSGGEKVDS
ncbi:MAG: hypothetical protein M1832_003325 [Thelocarpon impressellum]|nr:MAG: hypothetical protein M1832_003325 [Thelocarpon impressellum]